MGIILDEKGIKNPIATTISCIVNDCRRYFKEVLVLIEKQFLGKIFLISFRVGISLESILRAFPFRPEYLIFFKYLFVNLTINKIYIYNIIFTNFNLTSQVLFLNKYVYINNFILRKLLK